MRKIWTVIKYRRRTAEIGHKSHNYTTRILITKTSVSKLFFSFFFLSMNRQYRKRTTRKLTESQLLYKSEKSKIKCNNVAVGINKGNVNW